MVWAWCSGVGLRPLVPVRGTLNASADQETLHSSTLPTLWGQFGDGPFLFQHDRTPVHRASSIKTWMSESGVEELDWPALSPIEPLWDELEWRLRARPSRPTSGSDLTNVLLEEWKEVRTGPAYILLFIVLSCVSVCTVLLNLLVIISISHFKQLHTPTNLLLLSLSVADLLVGLVVMPVQIMKLIDSCWYLGKSGCTVYILISFVSVSASLCSLVYIAVDQFIAVSDPLLYSTRVTVCKTSLWILLGWWSCLFYVLLNLYYNDHLFESQISSQCYGECVLVLRYQHQPSFGQWLSSWGVLDSSLPVLARKHSQMEH
ncbi:hypothetical protein NFI96_010102 [Prochilodus magdalenae]|nr:hypothetical protein NFI96_010102 [Prochilodus magdalenae]